MGYKEAVENDLTSKGKKKKKKKKKKKTSKKY
jgi:hypothetical protein